MRPHVTWNTRTLVALTSCLAVGSWMAGSVMADVGATTRLGEKAPNSAEIPAPVEGEVSAEKTMSPDMEKSENAAKLAQIAKSDSLRLRSQYINELLRELSFTLERESGQLKAGLSRGEEGRALLNSVDASLVKLVGLIGDSAAATGHRQIADQAAAALTDVHALHALSQMRAGETLPNGPPMMGACCDGASCTDEIEADCTGVVMGTYLGDGTTCADFGPPGNACDCNDNGIFDPDDLLEGSGTTFTSSPALAIPDNMPLSPISDTQSLVDATVVTDVNVELNISHTWVGDLEVFLNYNNGVDDITVELTTDNGNGLGATNFTGTVLNDEATTLITSITAAGAPYTGQFIPEGSLSDFDGVAITGDWTLIVGDDATDDTGTLDSWTLIFNSAAPISTDCDGDGTLDECETPDPTTQGACCLTGGGCSDGTSADCTMAGGTYQGDCTSCAASACNDLCDDAISVAVPSSTLGSNVGANSDLNPSCGAGGANGSEVWYEITGTGNTITVSTCNQDTDFDTEVNIFCSTCSDPICVDGDDDSCGDPTLASEISFCSDSGETYLVSVGGASDFSTQGAFLLEITDDGMACMDPPDCTPLAGACCDGTTCSVLSPSACAAIMDAVYLGDGTDCTDNPCDDGACCLTDGMCVETTDEATCTGMMNANGFTLGEDCMTTVCPQPCPCNTTVTSFPFVEDFDAVSDCATTCGAACPDLSPSLWVNATDDDPAGRDWGINMGLTGSSFATGPDDDAGGGGKYAYTESSVPCDGGDTFVLQSPCIDLASLSDPTVTFAYHMFGVNMGDLFLEVSDDNCLSWTTLTTISGPQQSGNSDPWLVEQVSLSAFTGDTVNLRFRGVTGPGFESDIAIDDIRVGEAQVLTGACCDNEITGGCVEVEESACTGTDTFLGIGTTCEPDSCTATGACCEGDFTCSEVVQTHCETTLSGTYLGDGTACDELAPNNRCDCNGNMIFDGDDLLPTGGTFKSETYSPAAALADDCVVGSTPPFTFDNFTETFTGTAGAIVDMEVSLDISHTFVGDLVIDLTHESSMTTVRLVSRIGTAETGGPLCTENTNGEFGNGNSGLVVTLNDAAAQALEDQTGDVSGGDSFRPFEALSAFVGLEKASDWTLTIHDAATPDPGTLNSWTLNFINVAPNPPLLTDCDLNDLPDSCEPIDPSNRGACCLPSGTCTVTSMAVCSGITDAVYNGDCTSCDDFVCNDDCDSCIDVAPGSLPFTDDDVDLSLAGADPDISCNLDAGSLANGVWYCFQPTDDCSLSVNRTGGDTAAVVYTSDDDTCAGALTEVACSDPESFTVDVVGGTQYFINIGDWAAGAPPVIDVEIDCQTGACCLGGGMCDDTTATDCTDNQMGTFLGLGTSCSDMPDPCDSGACCAADGTCSLLSSGDCATAMGAYQGDGTNCDPNLCPQPNDDCLDSIALAVDTPVSGNNSGATDDITETCDGEPAPGNTLWYEFTGTGNTMTVSACDPNTSFDDTIHVYCGTCVDLVCAASDDDSCSAPDPVTAAEVSLCTTMGTTYYVAIGSDFAATGDFTIELTDDGMMCAEPVDCVIPTGACCDTVTCTDTTEGACTGTYLGDGTACDAMSPPNVCDCNNNGVFDADDLIEGGAVVTETSSPALAIPDGDTVTGVSDTLSLSDSTVITDVNVVLNITHGFTADIDVFLNYNNGVDDITVELTTDNGDAGDNYVDTQLSDEAGVAITAGVPPFTGGFRPEGMLSDFDGQMITGDWTLTVFDDDAAILGTLDSWTLQFNSGAPAGTDCDSNGTLDECESPDPSMTGACCMTDASCADGLTQGACEGMGGVYQGDCTFCEDVECPLPNDECADAISVAVGGSAMGDNTGAIDESTPFCGGTGLLDQGLWYSVTGDGNTLTATTCNPGTDFDTQIQVFCRDCDDLVCVGGNDDQDDNDPFDPACDSTGTGTVHRASTFSWCAEAGQEYFIAVGGFGSTDEGMFELSVSTDSTSCDDAVFCPVPTGACCGATVAAAGGGISCQTDVTQEACETAGGTYAGDFTDCAATGLGGTICDCNGNGVDDSADISATGPAPVGSSDPEPDAAIPSCDAATQMGVDEFLNDTLVVAGGPASIAGDMVVSLDVAHSFVGDLVIDLTNENSGTTVRLVERIGNDPLDTLPLCNDNGISFGNGNDDLVALLSDSASAELDSQTVSVSGGLAYTPFEALSAFDGEDSNGTWTLTLHDGAEIDDGSLRAWSIAFGAIMQTSPDCNSNGTPDECDIADCEDPEGTTPECNDCNGNSIPDECDIASGTSLDEIDGMANGIPDDCEPGDGEPCTRDCDCYIAGVGEPSFDVCDYHYCENDVCTSCARRWGNTCDSFAGFVQTDDILCAVTGFGNYCACPNGDLIAAGGTKGPSGSPLGTDDILAIVAAFGGANPFMCPVPGSGEGCDAATPPTSTGCGGPAAASMATSSAFTGQDLVAAPQSRRSANALGASFVMVPRQRAVQAGGLVEVDVYLSGVEGLIGFELGAAANGGRRGQMSLETVQIDSQRFDYVFNGLTNFPATDAELGRVGGAAMGGSVDVAADKQAYLGTFTFRVSDNAVGAFNVSALAEYVALYSEFGSITMNPVKDVVVLVTTASEGR